MSPCSSSSFEELVTFKWGDGVLSRFVSSISVKRDTIWLCLDDLIVKSMSSSLIFSGKILILELSDSLK